MSRRPPCLLRSRRLLRLDARPLDHSLPLRQLLDDALAEIVGTAAGGMEAGLEQPLAHVLTPHHLDASPSRAGRRCPSACRPAPSGPARCRPAPRERRPRRWSARSAVPASARRRETASPMKLPASICGFATEIEIDATSTVLPSSACAAGAALGYGMCTISMPAWSLSSSAAEMGQGAGAGRRIVEPARPLLGVGDQLLHRSSRRGRGARRR